MAVTPGAACCRLLVGALILLLGGSAGRRALVRVLGQAAPAAPELLSQAFQAAAVVFVLRFSVGRRTPPAEAILGVVAGSCLGAASAWMGMASPALVLVGITMLVVHHPCPARDARSRSAAAGVDGKDGGKGSADCVPTLDLWQHLLAAFWFASRSAAGHNLAGCLISALCHTAAFIAAAELVPLLSAVPQSRALPAGARCEADLSQAPHDCAHASMPAAIGAPLQRSASTGSGMVSGPVRPPLSKTHSSSGVELLPMASAPVRRVTALSYAHGSTVSGGAGSGGISPGARRRSLPTLPRSSSTAAAVTAGGPPSPTSMHVMPAGAAASLALTASCTASPSRRNTAGGALGGGTPPLPPRGSSLAGPVSSVRTSPIIGGMSTASAGEAGRTSACGTPGGCSPPGTQSLDAQRAFQRGDADAWAAAAVWGRACSAVLQQVGCDVPDCAYMYGQAPGGAQVPLHAQQQQQQQACFGEHPSYNSARGGGGGVRCPVVAEEADEEPYASAPGGGNNRAAAAAAAAAGTSNKAEQHRRGACRQTGSSVEYTLLDPALPGAEAACDGGYLPYIHPDEYDEDDEDDGYADEDDDGDGMAHAEDQEEEEEEYVSEHEDDDSDDDCFSLVIDGNGAGAGAADANGGWADRGAATAAADSAADGAHWAAGGGSGGGAPPDAHLRQYGGAHAGGQHHHAQHGIRQHRYGPAVPLPDFYSCDVADMADLEDLMSLEEVEAVGPTAGQRQSQLTVSADATAGAAQQPWPHTSTGADAHEDARALHLAATVPLAAAKDMATVLRLGLTHDGVGLGGSGGRAWWRDGVADALSRNNSPATATNGDDRSPEGAPPSASRPERACSGADSGVSEGCVPLQEDNLARHTAASFPQEPPLQQAPAPAPGDAADGPSAAALNAPAAPADPAAGASPSCGAPLRTHPSTASLDLLDCFLRDASALVQGAYGSPYESHAHDAPPYAEHRPGADTPPPHAAPQQLRQPGRQPRSVSRLAEKQAAGGEGVGSSRPRQQSRAGRERRLSAGQQLARELYGFASEPFAWQQEGMVDMHGMQLAVAAAAAAAAPGQGLPHANTQPGRACPPYQPEDSGLADNAAAAAAAQYQRHAHAHHYHHPSRGTSGPHAHVGIASAGPTLTGVAPHCPRHAPAPGVASCSRAPLELRHSIQSLPAAATQHALGSAEAALPGADAAAGGAHAFAHAFAHAYRHSLDTARLRMIEREASEVLAAAAAAAGAGAACGQGRTSGGGALPYGGGHAAASAFMVAPTGLVLEEEEDTFGLSEEDPSPQGRRSGAPAVGATSHHAAAAAAAAAAAPQRQVSRKASGAAPPAAPPGSAAGNAAPAGHHGAVVQPFMQMPYKALHDIDSNGGLVSPYGTGGAPGRRSLRYLPTAVVRGSLERDMASTAATAAATAPASPLSFPPSPSPSAFPPSADAPYSPAVPVSAAAAAAAAAASARGGGVAVAPAATPSAAAAAAAADGETRVAAPAAAAPAAPPLSVPLRAPGPLVPDAHSEPTNDLGLAPSASTSMVTRLTLHSADGAGCQGCSQAGAGGAASLRAQGSWAARSLDGEDAPAAVPAAAAAAEVAAQEKEVDRASVAGNDAEQGATS